MQDYYGKKIVIALRQYNSVDNPEKEGLFHAITALLDQEDVSWGIVN